MRGSGAPCTVVRAATAHAGAEVWRLAREVVLHFAHLEAPAREPVERGALVRVKHRVERGDVEEPRAVLAIAHRVLELVLVRRMLTDAVLEELLPLECGVVALVQDVPVRDGQLTLAIQAREMDLSRRAEEPEELRTPEEVGVDVIVLQDRRLAARGHDVLVP